MSDAIQVSGAWAERYRAFRDLRRELARDRAMYRQLVLANPGRVDAQTIAVVLHNQVRFAPDARDVFRGAFDTQEFEGGAMLFHALRPHLRVGDSERALVEAIERASNTAALAEACAYLFIEGNSRTVEVEEPDELLAEDRGADDLADAFDKPPAGYGG